MRLKTVFILFFLSGIAGLIYEIAWGRLLVLIFGATTNSLVAVISAFLGGLALGSLLVGRFVDRLDQRSLIKTYALLEAGVGLTAALSLILIPTIRLFYANFSTGSEVTLTLLLVKFGLAILIILLPTTLMGATLPILVKFISSSKHLPSKIVSLLYAVNTFGGMIGTALSAFVFIELFGIQNTILIAVIINLSIALWANLIAPKDTTVDLKTKNDPQNSLVFSPFISLVMGAFFVSGLISIAYQILWTRVLTPSLGTVIYAFASILIIYLFGIALGSLAYERLTKFLKSKILFFALCEASIGFFALLAVLLFHKFSLPGVWELLIRVLPSTILMGLTFPAVIGLLEDQRATGKVVGVSYFSNTIGTILGGFLASFVLIPILGTSQSIVFLAIFNFLIALLFILIDKKLLTFPKFIYLSITVLLILISSFITIFRSDRIFPLKEDFRIQDAKLRGETFGFKEDEVASVFAINDLKNKEQHLIIDGVETTHRVAETRLMAHIPITIHQNPKDMLVIAFGMGTTYRSGLKQGLNVDAVELVPSVPTYMNLFHADAAKYKNNIHGRIIINDGRNYAFLTDKRYDIVVIDPPPPFNTAGSTVLHSKEFYQDLAKKLKPNGLVSQWIYYNRSREDEISMAIKSFVEVFPYVVAIQTVNNVGGMYLEGSFSPIHKDRLKDIYKSEVVIRDMQEVLTEKFDPTQHFQIEAFADRNSLLKVVKNYPAITDNNPRSEYYLLRHIFTTSPILVNADAKKFISKFKQANN